MLRSLKDLRGVALRAIDGDIGKVDDFYFDDEGWGSAISSSTRASGCPAEKC